MNMTTIVEFPAKESEEISVMSKPLETILHVDDDADIRVIIKMSLETVGSFNVHQFASGQEAVEAAASVQPQMLLLDMMMPDMSGEEVWKLITQQPGLATVPTVFLTAKAEDSFSQELRRKGAAAVITKPVDPMLLASQIKEIWHKANQS